MPRFWESHSQFTQKVEMKIKKVSVYQKDLPLSEPYWLSGGRLKFEVLDATFVKIETDSGHIGWGEGTPWGQIGRASGRERV